MTEDMAQAIEIAVGDTISREGFRPTTASSKAKNNAAHIIRRFLAEVDESLTVYELREQLGDGMGRLDNTGGDDDE